jgi:predicted component of type VI protein secretion system
VDLKEAKQKAKEHPIYLGFKKKEGRYRHIDILVTQISLSHSNKCKLMNATKIK